MPFCPRSVLLILFLAGCRLLSRADSIQDGSPAGFRAYACDPGRSHVAYNAVHPFAKVRGVNHAPACTVWVSPDSAEFRIKVSLEVRAFKSGISLRDSHAMKAVAADSFPKVFFASDWVRPPGDRSSAGQPSTDRPSADRPSAGGFGPYAISGSLTFHGLTRPVQAMVTPEVKDGLILVRGGFPISLAEFRAKPPSLMGTKVKDRVEMTFEFVFNGVGVLPGGGPTDVRAE